MASNEEMDEESRQMLEKMKFNMSVHKTKQTTKAATGWFFTFIPVMYLVPGSEAIGQVRIVSTDLAYEA